MSEVRVGEFARNYAAGKALSNLDGCSTLDSA
jgi:hypothetical protein